MKALSVQLQVVHAILLRETKTRFGSNQLGYVWALIEPMLWVATFGGMYYVLGRMGPPGMDMVPFLVTGIVPFLMFRGTATQCMNAISGNKGLLFYPHVQPLDLVLARVLLEWTTYVLVFAVMMAVPALLSGELAIDNPLRIIVGFVLASGLGTGVGLVFCGLSVFSPTVERLQGPLLRPLFWLSGIFFVVDALPTSARDLLLYNPVLHTVELVRDGWFPGRQSQHVDAWYPAAWVLVLLFFGLSLERVARRRLQLT